MRELKATSIIFVGIIDDEDVKISISDLAQEMVYEFNDWKAYTVEYKTVEISNEKLKKQFINYLLSSDITFRLAESNANGVDYFTNTTFDIIKELGYISEIK